MSCLLWGIPRHERHRQQLEAVLVASPAGGTTDLGRLAVLLLLRRVPKCANTGESNNKETVVVNKYRVPPFAWRTTVQRVHRSVACWVDPLP